MRYPVLIPLLVITICGTSRLAGAQATREVIQAPEAHLPQRYRVAQSSFRQQLPSRSNPNISAADVPSVTLPPLDVQRVRHERDLRERPVSRTGSKNIPEPRAQEIGVNRDVQVRAVDGRWFSVSAGRAWMVDVRSPSALETRLHFTDFNLPAGVKLFVGSPNSDQETAAFEGKGPFGTGEFWSPIVFGDTVRLELLDSAGADVEHSGKLPFQVTSIAHAYDTIDSGGFGNSAPCELDFMCYPDYASVGGAIAKIQFSDAQFLYVCSATLVNNLSGDFSPLLLTAHHCIYTDALAKTVEVYWNYQSTACNSPYTNNVTTSNYATLLAMTTDATDASLLQIVNSVPSTSTWAAWTTAAPDVGSAVTGIHHPHADPKKISFGKRVTDLIGEPMRYAVNWDSGIMEPGSSGSPLLNANKQVVGQLYGGSSSCSNSGPDVYGRLSVSHDELTGPNGWNYLDKGIPDDQYAPNQTRDTAAVLAFPSMNTSLVAKITAEDWFRVTVAAGQSVLVKPTYDQMRGHLNFELYRASDGTEIKASLWPSYLPLTFTNSGGTSTDVLVHVSVAGGVRVDYSLEVQEPPPPTIETIETYANPYGSASMSMRATGNGWPVTGWFEWGTDATLATFAQTAPAVVPNSDNGTGNWIDSLMALSPATMYYYRGAGSSPGGTAHGQILSFTTAAYPAPTFGSPASGNTPSFFPDNVAITAGGDHFDLYFGTDPAPPLLASFAQADLTNLSTPTRCLYSPCAFLRLPLTGADLHPQTHYYWSVTSHYRGASASSPIFDFYTPPTATVSPATLSLGRVLVGTTARLKAYVSWTDWQHAGNTPSITGDGFSLQSDHYPAYEQIIINFQPKSAGSHTGSLVLSSPAVDGPTIIPVTAEAVNLELSRPVRPTRVGTTTIAAGKSQTMPFNIASAGMTGAISLSCEVVPAAGRCEVSQSSITGDGQHELEVTFHSERRSIRRLALHRSGDHDVVEPGTLPGTYTVRVTTSYGGVARTIDFPVTVR